MHERIESAPTFSWAGPRTRKQSRGRHASKARPLKNPREEVQRKVKLEGGFLCRGGCSKLKVNYDPEEDILYILTLPRLKFVGFSSHSRRFMAHTQLEFWAVPMQPLSHGTDHEPVLRRDLGSHGLPSALSSPKDYPCLPTRRPITSDTLIHRNLEATFNHERRLKLLLGTIHPTTKDRGLSCRAFCNQRRACI